MSLLKYILRPFRLLFGCDIPIKFLSRLNIAHPVGIVISAKARLGKNITVYPNVVIGGKAVKYGDLKPMIDDDVIIYSNCVIVGDIIIGKGAVIGANNFINRDVAPYEVVYHT